MRLYIININGEDYIASHTLLNVNIINECVDKMICQGYCEVIDEEGLFVHKGYFEDDLNVGKWINRYINIYYL